MKKESIEKFKKVKVFLLYTLIFFILELVLILIFRKYNKQFIWSEDGIRQHIVNLKYFRELLLEFLKTGSLSMHTWNAGLGFDLFSNFSYWILGDFFSYVCVLFSEDKIEFLYNLLIVVRMYFIGVSFLCYCRYKRVNDFSALIGSIIYTFCMYVLFSATRHPYFSNALILFPLVMIGIEKAILENKFIFYTIIIGIAYITNFYFACIISLAIAIYGVILTIYSYKKDGARRIIKVLLEVFLYSILGILISAVVFLPTIISFMSSERDMISIDYSYTSEYYKNIISNLLTVDDARCWAYWGMQSIAFIAIPVFFKRRKENYSLFLFMIIMILPLFFPRLGSIFNGFSYPNNRYTFIISFIFSYITVILLNSSKKLEKRELIYIGIFFAIYFALDFIFKIELNIYTMLQIWICAFILLLMINNKKFKKVNFYNIVLTVIVIFGLILEIVFRYDEIGRNYVIAFIENGEAIIKQETSDESIPDFKDAINYIKENDTDFFRIMKSPYFIINNSMWLGYNAIGGFFSIVPEAYQIMSRDLLNLQYNSLNYGIKEFDYRTKIGSILCEKYLIMNDSSTVPYGYSKIDDYTGESKIYINNLCLPFGVLYTSYISNEDYKSLSPLEKESSLLKNVSVDEVNLTNKNLTKIQDFDCKDIIKDVEYKINDYRNIMKEENVVTVDDSKFAFKLEIGEIENSELFVYIGGLKYNSCSKDTEYILGAGIQNVLKIQETKDSSTSPYYIQNR